MVKKNPLIMVINYKIIHFIIIYLIIIHLVSETIREKMDCGW